MAEAPPQGYSSWEDYYKTIHPGYQRGDAGSSMPTVAKSAIAAVAPSEVYRQPVPPGQWGTDSTTGEVLRGAGIAANQFGIGLLGIPMTALHYGWEGLHALDPSGFNAAPAWTSAEGPGSYGEGLTIGGLTPSTPTERVLARGSRAAGTAASAMPLGMGPVAAGVNALGGFVGGGLTEAGYPGAGAAVELGTGLATGLGTVARRMPIISSTPTWSSVAPTAGQAAKSAAQQAAARQAAQEAADVAALRRMEMMSPLTHRMPFGSGVLLNWALTRGLGGPSPATTTAQRLLGIPLGGAVGAGSAAENYPPPAMSYSAPPSFAPPVNQQQ